jgi:hypothetical protein
MTHYQSLVGKNFVRNGREHAGVFYRIMKFNPALPRGRDEFIVEVWRSRDGEHFATFISNEGCEDFLSRHTLVAEC